MTSAILTDLQTRIRSNTLTGPQQRALGDALDALIPTFPSPDELAGGIPNTEPILARDWIAPLYALSAEGSTDVLPTTVIAWWIDFLTGDDNNPGTALLPLKTIGALATLWRGTAGGGRPVLDPATGTTVTVHLESDFPDSDPLSQILDVDITDGNALIIVGAATVNHTGILATANTWARTVANGQVRITDGAVADFGAFIGVSTLVHDVTTGAIAWLYGPDTGSSATGTCTPGYSAQTAGSFPSIVQTNFVVANAYTLASLPTVAVGQGFVTRSFPQEGNNGAQVFVYRLHLGNPPSNPQAVFQSPTCGYALQECQYDLQLEPALGAVVLANCFGYHTSVLPQASGSVELLAGGLQGQSGGLVRAALGGLAIIDQDFAMQSDTPYSVGIDSSMIIGDAGFWTNGAATRALECSGGILLHNPLFGAEGVFYGTDGGTVCTLPRGNGAGAVVLDSGVTAVNQFACSHSNFTCGGQTSTYGFDQAAGTFTGPTTCTFAHLDAALAAGTGFGGSAVDPQTGCTMSKG